MDIRISKKNVKLGNIWNLNLPPKNVCQEKPCYKEGCCYNAKAWRQYPSVRISWKKNWDSLQESSDVFFETIINKIKRSYKKPYFFRWHAAGEIPTQEYLEGMKKASLTFPEIKFLVYTKQYFLTFENIPSNLQIIISAWPNLDISDYLLENFPIAWMLDGRETRHESRKTFKCPGKCSKCKICWKLGKIKKDVCFTRH